MTPKLMVSLNDKDHRFHYITLNLNTFLGVVHNDELIYLFYIEKMFPLLKDNSQVEVLMVNKLTSLIANFAKSG